MKLPAPLIVFASYAWLALPASLARADEHGEGHREMRAEHAEEHHEARAEERKEERKEDRHEARAEERKEDRHEMRGPGHEMPPPRPMPAKFAAHPPGVHPHGPTVHPHAVRVLRPTVAKYGKHPWRHWEHPVFARPSYYWEWGVIHNVTCVSEDSYGDQYPVTESTFRGFGLVNMTAVEDDALDRCYQESGGDPSCTLATCSHF